LCVVVVVVVNQVKREEDGAMELRAAGLEDRERQLEAQAAALAAQQAESEARWEGAKAEAEGAAAEAARQVAEAGAVCLAVEAANAKQAGVEAYVTRCCSLLLTYY